MEAMVKHPEKTNTGVTAATNTFECATSKQNFMSFVCGWCGVLLAWLFCVLCGVLYI
jgi:hypothetical protein